MSRVSIFSEDFDDATNSAGKHIIDLVDALKASGEDVDIFTVTYKKSESGKKIDKSTNIRYFRMLVKNKADMKYEQRFFHELSLGFRMFFFIIKNGQLFNFSKIIWYSPTIFWGTLVFLLGLFNKTRTFLILRDIFPEWVVNVGLIKRNTFQYHILRFFELIQYKVANTIGIQSNGDRKFFERIPWAKNKLVLLKTWYHAQPNAEKVYVNKKFNISEKKTIIYSGNLGVAQDREMIIDMVNHFPDKENYHFLFVGLKNKDKDEAEKQVNKYMLEHISFLDPMPFQELSSLLASSLLGILSLDRRLEANNIPGKFLHYLSVGIPVFAVINPNNDLKEIIVKNKLGACCVQNNPKSAAKNLMELCEEIQKGEFNRANAFKYLEKEHNPKKAIQLILSYINK